MKENIHKLLKEIATSSDLLMLLKDDPEKIREKFKFSNEEFQALVRADLLISLVRPANTYTTSPITITVTSHGRRIPDRGDPDPGWRER